MDTWITDTPTSERFPLYTRGNADEVGPKPLSPLGWSLSWAQGICPGVADGWCSLGGFTPDEFAWPVPETFGNWGGYFFNQVSVGRVFGVRTPGGSPDMIDESFFGKNPTVPPYVPDPRDESAERSAAIGEVFAGVLGADRQPQYLTDFIAQVHEWVTDRPDLASLSDAELIEFGRETNLRLRADLGRLHGRHDRRRRRVPASSADWPRLSVSRSSRWRHSARSAMSRARAPRAGCGGSRGPPVTTRRCRANSTRGPTGALDRLRGSSDPAAARFVRDFDEMIAVDGHRGPNEWEIMSDSWVMNPLLPLGMIDKLRRQVDHQSPDNRTAAISARRDEAVAELRAFVADDAGQQRHAGRRSAVRGRVLPGAGGGQGCRSARHARSAAAVRRTRPALGRVRCASRSEARVHAARLASWTRVSPPPTAGHSAWPSGPIYSPTSIPGSRPTSSPTASRSRRSRRGGVAPIAAPSSPGAGDELTGLGVAPGHATGPARVVFDLSEISAVEPGDILVCSTTDPVLGTAVPDRRRRRVRRRRGRQPRRHRQPRARRPVRGLRARRPAAHSGRRNAGDRRD